MNALATMKRLVEIGLPAKWLVPVMEAFENPEVAEPARRKRRKRRTKEEMARDAAKKNKVKRKRKVKAAPSA